MADRIYEMVTARIIDQLEQGLIPWVKPWIGTGGAWSGSTGKAYSLINQFLLPKGGEFYTFKQVQALGGKVKKGAKSHLVVFWKVYQKETENKDGEKVVKSFPILRYYNVFHVDDCEGIKQKYQKAVAYEHDPIEEAERVKNDYVKRSGVTYRETESERAFYRPFDDSVTVPGMSQFKEIEEFYSTVFHELAHSTGAVNRLNRDGIARVSFKGDEEYSKEELVAEITSAAVCSAVGIETEKTFKNSSAYIQGWLSVLKNDSKFIVSASSRASKAFDLIMGNETAVEGL